MTVGTSLKGTYTYDGLERLASRSLTNMTPSGTTRFIHMLGGGGALEGLMPEAGESFGGLGNRIIAESYGAGLQVREYVWLGDQVVAVSCGMTETIRRTRAACKSPVARGAHGFAFACALSVCFCPFGHGLQVMLT